MDKKLHVLIVEADHDKMARLHQELNASGLDLVYEQVDCPTACGTGEGQGRPTHPEAERAFRHLNEELDRRFQEKTAQLFATNQRLQKEIEERERIEGKLRESEERYRTLVELSPDAVGVIVDGKVAYANEATARLFGAKRVEDMIGLESSDFTHPDFKELAMERRQRIAEGEPFAFVEMKIVGLDNEVRYIESLAAPIIYQGKSAIVSINRDISTRKQAEEALRKSEAQNRALLSAVPDIIFRITRDGTILDYKPAKDKAYRLQPQDLIGKTVQEILPHLASEIMHTLESATQTGTIQFYEFSLTHSNGEIHEYEARFVAGEGEVVIIVRDITERKKVERLKQEFISIVSHELRTPLTSIRGSLGLLVEGVVGDIPDAAKKMVDIAYKNCERLVALINDILDIEKIEAGKINFQLQPLELMPLIEQAIEENRSYAALYDVSFELVETMPGVKVRADSSRLIQVVTNLLSNAAKFSPVGEKVRITVSRQGENIRVEVSDQGPGVPTDFRDRLFEKFSQADAPDSRQVGGTGLGLSIVKAIIERHGGQVGFDSQTGGGSLFYFEIPEWTT